MSFEKLRVYLAAELLDSEIQRLIAKARRARKSDIDQLHRAVGSLLNNIPKPTVLKHSGVSATTCRSPAAPVTKRAPSCVDWFATSTWPQPTFPDPRRWQ